MVRAEKRILVTCAKGISPYLRQEVEALRLPVVSDTVSGVWTAGTMRDVMRLNLNIRTGHRVLLFLKEFRVRRVEEFYEQIRDMPWEEVLAEDGYVSVSSHVETPLVNDSRYANQKCKDAIVDRFRERFGRRPDSGPEKNSLVVFLHWKEDACSVFIDTSGEPLSRRNYRKIPFKAPMQESLAAAVVMATRWKGEGHFINPMCGSGTLAVEAAMAALRIAPGSLRDNFGFMHVRGYDPSVLNLLRAEAGRKVKKGPAFRIIATDMDSRAVDAARRNARAAGVERFMEFAVCDYRDTAVPGGGGVVVVNPAYGKRLGRDRGLEALYQGIGDFFKNKCTGYRGYIFTGNLGMAKKVGLRTNRRLEFYNGAIECRLLEYEMYEGSRKSGRSDSDAS